MKQITKIFSAIIVLALISTDLYSQECLNYSSYKKSVSIGFNNNNDYTLGVFSYTLGWNMVRNNNESILIGCGAGDDMLLSNPDRSIALGLGSTVPTMRITMSGNNHSTGKVIIGNVASPQAKLHIKSDANLNSSILLETTSTNNRALIMFKEEANQISVGSDNIMNFTASGFKFNTGKVGIGCDNTSDEFVLAVKGGILTDDVLVRHFSQWPDFVFSKDYSLMPLSELKGFIDTNKHLPNVPSETEVTENGVSVGEMQTVLLQKVEELTLYTIYQQEMIDQLREQCERQQEMIDKLMGK